MGRSLSLGGYDAWKTTDPAERWPDEAPREDEGLPEEERFVTPVPLPEGLKRELLVILIEECAEVQQRATKALRFGMDEVQPGQPDTNARRLALEVGDLLEVLARLENFGVDNDDILEGMAAKRKKLDIYLQNRESHHG